MVACIYVERSRGQHVLNKTDYLQCLSACVHMCCAGAGRRRRWRRWRRPHMRTQPNSWPNLNWHSSIVDKKWFHTTLRDLLATLVLIKLIWSGHAILLIDRFLANVPKSVCDRNILINYSSIDVSHFKRKRFLCYTGLRHTSLVFALGFLSFPVIKISLRLVFLAHLQYVPRN